MSEFANALSAVLERSGFPDEGEIEGRGCVETKAALAAVNSFDDARALSFAGQVARLDLVWSTLRLIPSLILDE